MTSRGYLYTTLDLDPIICTSTKTEQPCVSWSSVIRRILCTSSLDGNGRHRH